MKKWVWWLIFALVLGLAMVFWGAKELVSVINPEPEPPLTSSVAAAPAAVQVDVVRVRQQTLAQEVAAVGSLLAQNAVTLRAESSGRIAAILFEEGTRAQAGQVLVQLDTDVLQAELQQAQAALQLAASRAHRAQQLHQQGFISSQAQDESQSERAVAAAQVKIIQTRIEKSQIKAPFSGMLGLRYVSVGDYVANGTEIVDIASIDQLQVDFRIPEQYLGQIQVGTPIRLRLDALAQSEFIGQVNAISPMIDEQGRSVVLRAHVPNPDGRLRPGQFARIVVELDEMEALVVPETAIVPSGQAHYVYRVTDQDQAQRVEVQIGIRRDGWVQVSGLQPDDVVLVTGLQKVQDGTPLRYQRAELAQP